MKLAVLPADTYIVINKTVLNDCDKNIITMLYQPIIGCISASLYFTLWSYLNKLEVMSNEWTHHHLMTSLRINLEEIIIAKEKLEGIGLLKTYYKETNGIKNFVYELYSPMSAYEFLTNPILATSLCNNIGNTEYSRILKYYKKPSIELAQYTDITNPFNDVFKVTAKTNYELITDEIRKSNKRKLELISKIDLNDIFSSIPEELINYKKINKETKELIYNLSFIYNLDNSALIEIILNSIDDKKTIDKELLKENARNYYKFENNGKLPSIIFKDQPDHLCKDITDTSKRSKMIHIFETTTPYDFLKSKQGSGEPTKRDLRLLEYLLIDLELVSGVVNVLIDVVLKTNDNKLSKAYIETIAGQWKRNNIKTVEEAMDIASKENCKRNIRTKTYKKEEAKPEWFDKEIDVVPMTKEEKQELENMLKEFN